MLHAPSEFFWSSSRNPPSVVLHVIDYFAALNKVHTVALKDQIAQEWRHAKCNIWELYEHVNANASAAR